MTDHTATTAHPASPAAVPETVAAWLAALPADWAERLAAEFTQPYLADLAAFVASERARAEVYPPEPETFAALAATSYTATRVVVIGQDPYHGPGQAHGMCFSVRPGVRVPPSLRNIFREMNTDLGHRVPASGDLTPWARRGVLLLNTCLTVRAGEAGSHTRRGWERFTDAVITALAARDRPVVFVLWGNHAKKKLPLIDTSRHGVVAGAHPSPLSARLFFGSRPFSAINAELARLGQDPVDFRLP